LSALNQILELLSSCDKSSSKDDAENHSSEKVVFSTMLLSCVSLFE